jgi:hypothetical protein
VRLRVYLPQPRIRSKVDSEYKNQLFLASGSNFGERQAEANNLKGVIDQTDFNDPAKLGSGKEMVDRLSNLVGIFDKSSHLHHETTSNGMT